LASGGNDNKVILWDLRTLQMQWIIKEHKAAVRALAWNPHASGVLATGGGNSDKTIKIFSSLTNTEIQTINVV
jgi:WD40 repeat protein